MVVMNKLVAIKKKNEIIMNQYSLVYKIYNDNIDLVNEIIEKSNLPHTFKALKNFHSKIEELTSSLECIAVNNSFYSSQCLTRVLIEHFIVGYYIFTKCRIDESDECGEDYYQYYTIYETMKQENYNSKLDKSYNQRISPLENFFLKVPEFSAQDVSQSDFEEINRRSNKFDIRKVLKFFQEDLDESDFYKETQEVLISKCREYNKLSSFVHGGPTAELVTFNNSPIIDKEMVMKENIEFGKVMSYQILTYIMTLLVIEDKRFIEKYTPLHEFIIEGIRRNNEKSD